MLSVGLSVRLCVCVYVSTPTTDIFSDRFAIDFRFIDIWRKRYVLFAPILFSQRVSQSPA